MPGIQPPTGPGGARTGGDASDAPSLLAKALRELRPGASAVFVGEKLGCFYGPMDIYGHIIGYHWISLDIIGYHWISLDIYGL